MSGNSIFKPFYDQYTVDLFRADGWNALPVNKKGWYCDVIAIRQSELALVEVKSPAECSIMSNYDDMRGLAPNLASQFPRRFRNRRRSILQNIVADEIRGRIMSVFMFTFAGFMPFGNLLAGSLAQVFGVSQALLINGIICAIFFIVINITYPKIREL